MQPYLWNDTAKLSILRSIPAPSVASTARRQMLHGISSSLQQFYEAQQKTPCAGCSSRIFVGGHYSRSSFPEVFLVFFLLLLCTLFPCVYDNARAQVCSCLHANLCHVPHSIIFVTVGKGGVLFSYIRISGLMRMYFTTVRLMWR